MIHRRLFRFCSMRSFACSAWTSSYARLKNPVNAESMEILRVSDSCELKMPAAGDRRDAQKLVRMSIARISPPPIRSRFGDEDISIFPIPLGIQARSA